MALRARSPEGAGVSQYRDKAGRYRERNGLDILEEYGACVMIALVLTSFWWVKPCFQMLVEVMG